MRFNQRDDDDYQYPDIDWPDRHPALFAFVFIAAAVVLGGWAGMLVIIGLSFSQ